jgi:hypothetical protein
VLRPVVNYVSHPHWHGQIEEQPCDARQDAIDTRILAVQGLGGSGESQLVLDYMQQCPEDYSSIFWVEAGQPSTIEIPIWRILPTVISQLGV